MKYLWSTVALLAIGIFLWQAGRIWVGEHPTTSNTVTPANVATNTNAAAAVPTLDTTPQTHTVETGETLNSIGLKYNLKWTSIAALNGLSEDSVLQIGQLLNLPITVSGHLIDVETIPVSQTDAQNAQNNATFGGITWRLDPVEVARQTSPSSAGILHDTPLELTSRDDEAGTAVVTATVNNSKVIVTLSQPTTKGSGGVWFVTKTESYRWPN